MWEACWVRRHWQAGHSSGQTEDGSNYSLTHSDVNVAQTSGAVAQSTLSSARYIWTIVVLLGVCFSPAVVEGSDAAPVLPIGGESSPAFALPFPRDADYDRTPSTGLDYQEGNMLQGLPPTEAEKTVNDKKWTGPDDKTRARILYNYLLSRRMGNDLFGKRMGSSFPTKNFRFFTSAYKGNGGLHGSEFLGKRGQGPGNHLMSASEFLGKRARVSEFLGKRSKVSEFLGKRAGISEFLGKRARISEFLGKRARVSEFLGKRSDSPKILEKRARVSEFLGKRDGASEFLGKRAGVSEFLGKRPNTMDLWDLSSKRARISEFLGKRGRGRGGWTTRPRDRVSEFLGKRDDDGRYNTDGLEDEDDLELTAPDQEPDEDYANRDEEEANSTKGRQHYIAPRV